MRDEQLPGEICFLKMAHQKIKTPPLMRASRRKLIDFVYR
jgi:hypothetical protein